MAKYFTAYKIGHILDFFMIWELPDYAATGKRHQIWRSHICVVFLFISPC